MSDLLIRPKTATGKTHTITPESAGWGYVGFGCYRLRTGDTAAEATGEREAILVLVEGKAEVTAGGQSLGVLGQRISVFEQSPPVSVYVPRRTRWTAKATTDCVLGVCTAPAKSERSVQVIADVERVTRGVGTNTRYIYPIAMEERDVADSLLVTEVFTPSGHWSSYPPHRHDEDDDPRMTYLEETYYHRLNPPHGYGHQRVFTEDGSLDETMTVHDHDVVLVPKGHHPCGVPHGYEMYYLNVMAGPLRKWRFQNHPDHDWIVRRDAAHKS
ncbi:MAG: 5-deoxy-glucuronate isomerase [Pseudomonadota bacterium]